MAGSVATGAKKWRLPSLINSAMKFQRDLEGSVVMALTAPAKHILPASYSVVQNLFFETGNDDFRLAIDLCHGDPNNQQPRVIPL
jgi:hypothetical protein